MTALKCLLEAEEFKPSWYLTANWQVTTTCLRCSIDKSDQKIMTQFYQHQKEKIREDDKCDLKSFQMDVDWMHDNNLTFNISHKLSEREKRSSNSAKKLQFLFFYCLETENNYYVTWPWWTEKRKTPSSHLKWFFLQFRSVS